MLRGCARERGLRKNERYDKAVQPQGFGEDKNKDHAHEEFLLLSDRSYTRVTHDTDCHACRQATASSGRKDGESTRKRWGRGEGEG